MECLLSIWSWLGNNASPIIALCALGFTAYQVSLSRRHNVISVIPHLAMNQFTKRSNDRIDLSVHLLNNGLGPAKIKKLTYLFGDEKVNGTSNLREIEARINSLIESEGKVISVSGLAVGSFVKENHDSEFLTLVFDNRDKKGEDRLRNFMMRFNMSIDYESAYGDEYNFSSS
ncbi:MAG: hypothetical protein RPU32_09335 [Candidatus Sedimenticola sp. (ex Thyasira tokunagai)]